MITGGSAGGYTTLAALAFHDFFHGGASYYGVSDIAALARDTHKFESRYLDWLIGPYPQEEALYRERSPLFHADRLSKPVIFFQGDEDAVVPPNQTEAMVEALRRKGNPVGYFLFAGEQHGFRKAAQHPAQPRRRALFLRDRGVRDRPDVLIHTGAGTVRPTGSATSPSRCRRPAVCHTIVRRSIARANVSNRIDSSRIITIAPNTCGDSRMVR